MQVASSLQVLASAIPKKTGESPQIQLYKDGIKRKIDDVESQESNQNESDEGQDRKRASRLSVSSSLKSEVSPTNGVNDPNLADQLQLSIKLKEQQEALINARHASSVHSPNVYHFPGQPISPSLRRNSFLYQSLGMPSAVSASPRQDDRTNGLKISTESPFSSLPSISKPLLTPQGKNIQQPNLSPSVNSSYARRAHGSPINRHQFIDFFDSVFDSFEKTDQLSMILNEQIQQSNSLIQVLRASGNTIENLVGKHFKEMQSKITEKYALALTDLNRRLKKIEENLDIPPMSARIRTPSPKAQGNGVRQIDQLVNK